MPEDRFVRLATIGVYGGANSRCVSIGTHGFYDTLFAGSQKLLMQVTITKRPGGIEIIGSNSEIQVTQ